MFAASEIERADACGCAGQVRVCLGVGVIIGAGQRQAPVVHVLVEGRAQMTGPAVGVLVEDLAVWRDRPCRELLLVAPRVALNVALIPSPTGWGDHRIGDQRLGRRDQAARVGQIDGLRRAGGGGRFDDPPVGVGDPRGALVLAGRG